MKKHSAFRSVPWVFSLPATLGVILIVGPLLGLAFHIPWGDSWTLLTQTETLKAAKLSVTTAIISTLICGLLGLPLSLIFTRVLDRTKARKIALILYAFLYTPVILSPVVSGLALTFFWGRKGLIGSWLYQLGISLPFTPVAVVLTQIFVGLPFFVATAVTTLRTIPAEFEDLALVEGASPWEVTSKVLLPLAGPGISTAFLLAFARALGEYGATITFAGNIADKTRTIPLNIELMLSSNYLPEALGSSLMLISLYVMILGIALLLIALQRLRGTR